MFLFLFLFLLWLFQKSCFLSTDQLRYHRTMKASEKKPRFVWAIRRWWVPTRNPKAKPLRNRKTVGFWQLHPRLSWQPDFWLEAIDLTYGCLVGHQPTKLEINQPSWNESCRPVFFLVFFSRSNVSSSDPTTADHEVWTKRLIFVVEMAVPGCKSIESTWIHVSKLRTEKIQP